MTDLTRVERAMRPRGLFKEGLLGFNESLVDILRDDNATIKGIGLTHKEIARCLNNHARNIGYPAEKDGKLLNGKYIGRVRDHKTMDRCPWFDTTSPLWNFHLDFSIRNIRSNEVLEFYGVMEHLIGAHGFYGGNESPYRVDPKRIVRILELK